MLDPAELVTFVSEPADLDAPVLLVSLTGFIDAGGGGRLVKEHLLTSFENSLVATFDVDQVFDYRARRPSMLFIQDHWESYDDPGLALHAIRDTAGTGFLLLEGAEPDVQWERFISAVTSLVERFGVRLTVGVHGIPMAVPHTRPVGITAHGTRPELTSGHQAWIDTVQVPGSAQNLLELRLGQAGHDAVGFAAHVPHYVADATFPAGAIALLEAVSAATGLQLAAALLADADRDTRAALDQQVAASEEIGSVVTTLESQYDAFVAARDRGLLAPEGQPLPTGDELGAELERFLAEEARRNDGRESP
ncbi:MAG TPA: PAC2 family protein [Mycobacteriales bacterium]|nr:PAC2 family protein [Mycobacteriales bacterium]